MADNSPPSSKKSSVLGKLDRPETPNRGSPYLTRSRRSSTLTEENLAVHNDTPTTRNSGRRITRRMSQSNDSAVVLTPMVQSRRSSRRSPSVASGDDINATPKKKFSVAQENVVIEEDETMEDSKLQSTVAGTNGSKIGNEVDKENINTTLNGSVSEENLQRKSPDSNKTSPVVEQPAEPKVATEAITVDSNKQNALPVETSALTIEPLKPIVSTTQSNYPSSASSPNQLPITKPQTAVAITQQVEPDSTKSSDSPLNTLRESTTETRTTTDVKMETTNISPKLDATSQSELNGTVLEMKTPTRSSSLSMSDVIVIADTPNSSIMGDIIIVPETPVQTRQESLQMTPSQMTDTPEIKTPEIATPEIKTPEIATPKTVAIQSIQRVDSPKTVTRQSIQRVDSPKTPLQTKKSGTLVVTPLSIIKTPKAVPVTQQPERIASPKTPLQSRKSVKPNVPASVTVSLATQETPKSVLGDTAKQVVNLTESEEEILLRTPPTPSKKTTEHLQTPSAADGGSVSKLEVSPLKTAPLQNGILDANDENPKWANSIRRKSDGQPIDKFGVDNTDTKVTTLEAKSSKNETSTVNIGDTSDEESCIDADSNNETEPANMFLDDEAMESNGEASMDEEERKYLEENEIPEDGISLGSESDEGVSEEEESDDSFIVSDSSVQLLDGSGDDLGIENESAELNTSKSKAKRGNKILDTSDEELESTEEPKKSSKKRRPESSLNRTAKYLRVDAESEDANEGGDEDELVNLDVEPKKTRSSKRFSESTSLSKSDTKRLSLHPNTKLSFLESKKEQRRQSTLKNNRRRIDDDSEEDVTQELANMDEEPKKTNRSKTLSESLESPKKDVKRMSLHPNTKLSDVESVQKENKQTTGQNDVEEELANLDVPPKNSKNNKRLSELNSLSKKEMKLLSLHTNTKLSSLGSNENGLEQNQQQSTVNEGDSNIVSDEDVQEELANLDDGPKQMGKSKRLSLAMSLTKKDTNRFSLHPDTKLNRSGLDIKVDEPIVDDSNEVEKMDIDQSAPSVSQAKKEMKHSVEEIQARCNEVLQMANETKRLAKLNKKPMEEGKYQRLQEKNTTKKLEKQAKKARQEEREALAAERRQSKRDKKSRIAEVTEEEKSQAIEKALKFSEKLKAVKVKHSSEVTEKPLDESTDVEPTTSKRKRKPKKLQILNEGSNPTKKKRVADTEQFAAKPEGFKINSVPVKSNKVRKDIPSRIFQGTSAGDFEIEPLPTKSASPFVVTTLQYNSAIKFSSFKDKAIANSNVQRVSSAQLLKRKRNTKRN